jgi:hypothetical protein
MPAEAKAVQAPAEALDELRPNLWMERTAMRQSTSSCIRYGPPFIRRCRMRSLSLRAMVAAVAGVVALASHGAEIPRNLVEAVKRAEDLGKVLIDAELPPNSPEFEDLITAARSKLTDLCNLQYKPIIATLENKRFVFFIAQPPAPEYMVFGRHFRVHGDDVSVSTNTCVAFPPAPPDKPAAGAFITHLLSDAPTEFHVYVSSKHRKPVYVGTRVGTWKVDGPKVTFLEKR